MEIIYLTDSMSLKPVASGIGEAILEYTRVTDPNQIRKIIEENKENINCKIKRNGYAYGLSKITGLQFFPAESSTIIDIPFGGTAINVGLANPTKEDIDNLDLWDKGLFELELRIIKVCKK